MPIYQTVPIFAAIETGNFQIFANLLDADPKLAAARNEDSWMPLHFIAALGTETASVYARMVKKLISLGADINCRTVLGWTPLHLIAMQGQKEAVDVAKILMEEGADLKAIDKHGQDWRVHWQHGREIRDVLEHAETEISPAGL